MVVELGFAGWLDVGVRYRGVAQLVAHTVWDREVAGSSPVAPTTAYMDEILVCLFGHREASDFFVSI